MGKSTGQSFLHGAGDGTAKHGTTLKRHRVENLKENGEAPARKEAGKRRNVGQRASSEGTRGKGSSRQAMTVIDSNANAPMTRSMARALRAHEAPAEQAAPMEVSEMTLTMMDDCPADMCAPVKRKLANVLDIDEHDRDDTLQVIPYVERIFKILKAKENDPLVRPNVRYMDEVQTDINAKMRGILVDWEFSVSLRFSLHSETVFLAVDILDRFLSRKDVHRSNLQLVGVTAMLIACKFEESYSPLIEDFERISDGCCCRSDILAMEKTILTTLNFEMCTPNALHFLRRYSKVSRYDIKTHTLAKYLIELTLPSYRMLAFAPSLVAATATYVANLMMTRESFWDDTMVHYTGFEKADLMECAHAMNKLVDTPATEKSVYRWVKAKYHSRSLFAVSKMASVPIV